MTKKLNIKRSEKPEWKPREGQYYWVVEETGDVDVVYFDRGVCKERIKFGNYFRTQALAKKASKAIRNLLKTLPHG